MIRQRLVHHFVPHQHSAVDGDGAGEHHRAHGASLGALFAYLQIFIVLVGGFYLIAIKAPQILGTASFGADQIVSLTNGRRAENGLPPLSANGQLAQAATQKASDMFGSNYWAHNSPSGKTPWSFIVAAGYRYVFAGENLARDFNDATSVVSAWMNSPSHRSNILDKNFKEIGVAVSSGKLDGREGILVVQMFGSQVSQIPTSEKLAEVSPKPQPSASPAAIAQIQPSPVTEVSPIPSQFATPVSVAVFQTEAETATVLASRQFSIAKAVSLVFVGLIFLLFALEVLVSVRRADLSVRSGVIAHLGFLGFVLLALWYAVGGAIL